MRELSPETLASPEAAVCHVRPPSIEVITRWPVTVPGAKCATAFCASFGSKSTWYENGSVTIPPVTSVQVWPPSVERATPPGRRDASKTFELAGETAMRVVCCQLAVPERCVHEAPPSVLFSTPAPRTKWCTLRERCASDQCPSPVPTYITSGACGSIVTQPTDKLLHQS